MSDLSEYIKEHKEGKWALNFAPSVYNYKKHTWLERVKYTHKRGWFIRKHYFNLLLLPCVATDFDIFCDFAWRDLNQSKKRK